MSSVVTSPLSYLAYDLMSNQYLGRLPLGQVSFGSTLNSPQQLSGQIDIASDAVLALGPLQTTAPARTALVVDYMGAVVWSGIIWPRSYAFDGTTRKLQVTASEIWSYFSQRVQATDYSSPPYSGITGTGSEMPIWDASSSYSDSENVWDPLLISWQIISDALSVDYGDILGGLGIAANGFSSPAAYLASGTNTPQDSYLSVNYPYTSLQQVSTIVTQLAQNGLYVGFDFGVDVAYSGLSGSALVGTVNLSFPRRGRTYAENGLVLNCKGAISYQPPEDGTQAANTVYEEGISGSLVVAQNINPLEQGYPLLEQIMSRSNITSATILDVLSALGIADLYAYSYPVVTPSVTFDLFSDAPAFGDVVVGDDCRWIVPSTDGTGQLFDPRFPDGLDEEWRVTGYQATVNDEGQSTIQYALAQPPATDAIGPAI